MKTIFILILTLQSIVGISQDVNVELFNMINTYRKVNGVNELVWSDKAFDVCETKSNEMVNNHDNIFERLDKLDVSVMHENIIKVVVSDVNTETLNLILNGWINSPNHKSNLLSGNAGSIAVTYENTILTYKGKQLNKKAVYVTFISI